VPWRGTWESEGGGTTLCHGIHQIDLLAYLLGDWSSVSGELWRLDRDIEVEDTSLATIRFAGGAIASVVSSAVAPREVSHVRIDTDRATVEVEHLYGHGRANWRITPAPGVDAATAAEWALPEDDVPSGHAAYFDAVYPALVAGEPVPPVAGYPSRSLEIVTAIHTSSRLGRAITPADLDDPSNRGSLRASVAEPPR
jgi:predicted dehydrogenase